VSRPSPFAVSLTATQRRVLEGRLRRPTAQQREVVRARIVLQAADGEQNIRIAGRLGVAVNTVSKWRKRFVEEGLGGLGDRKRPGRPRRFPLGGGGGGQGDRL
jgi:transposase-like protein